MSRHYSNQLVRCTPTGELTPQHTGIGGSSGDGRLSKIGTALTVIFVLSFMVLFAELYYFAWRRRVFRQKNNSTVGGDHLTQCSSSTALSSSLAYSKVLYFFCLRPNSRLDRNSITPTNSTSDLDLNKQSVIDMDMQKIQSVFRPPRFLFTIKEEEAEDLDSPAEQKEGKKIDHRSCNVSVSLEEVEGPVAAAVEIEDATPFSTPCASPIMYFTPSASPAREAVKGRSISM